MTRIRTLLLFLAAFLLACSGAALSAEPDWTDVPRARVTMFYSGVASWEFLTGEDHSLGGRGIKAAKKDCRHCHLSKDGELDLKADDIASGAARMKRSHNPFEPEPLPGKKGTMTADVQAAYDKGFIYIKIEWSSRGGAWKPGAADSGAPDRVSIQANRNDALFRKYGCFLSCHSDVASMPLSPSRKEVKAHPYYSALGRDDVRLYATYAKGSWSRERDSRELSKRLKDNSIIDLWSAELTSGTVKAHDGWIFDDRTQDVLPHVAATGQWAEGRYSVVFKRALSTGDDRDLQAADGEAFSAGLAIHDGGEKRRHYVSFPFTIGLGADADVRAKKLGN